MYIFGVQHRQFYQHNCLACSIVRHRRRQIFRPRPALFRPNKKKTSRRFIIEMTFYVRAKKKKCSNASTAFRKTLEIINNASFTANAEETKAICRRRSRKKTSFGLLTRFYFSAHVYSRRVFSFLRNTHFGMMDRAVTLY